MAKVWAGLCLSLLCFIACDDDVQYRSTGSANPQDSNAASQNDTGSSASFDAGQTSMDTSDTTISSTNCNNDIACALGNICVCPQDDCGSVEAPTGMCVPGCREDVQCAEGLQCTANVCVPLSCETDDVADCGAVRPMCPEGTVATVRNGCHACVDSDTCEAEVWSCRDALLDEAGVCRGLNGAVHPDVCCRNGVTANVTAVHRCEDGQEVLRLYWGEANDTYCGAPPELVYGLGDFWFEITIRTRKLESQQVYAYQAFENNDVTIRRCRAETGECADAVDGTIWIGYNEPGEFIEGGFNILDSRGAAYENVFFAGYCDWGGGGGECP